MLEEALGSVWARRLGWVLVVAATLALTSPAAAAPPPGDYGDHDSGGFRNIQPPAQGTNGNVAHVAAFLGTGAYPPHTSDKQLDMYSNLVYATPGLNRTKVPDYYKDATFGVRPGHAEGTESPRSDVTIVRDKLGVPHIYGSSRAGAMFG